MSIAEALRNNRKQFLKFNDLKYTRFQELLPNVNIKRVINSIPLLLSVNDKKLPGYVEGEVPLGVVNYTPEEDMLKYFKGRFRLSKIEYKHEEPVVEMLSVMGSIGTIAYTKKSDFDYWACVDKKSIKPALLQNFQKKIDEIQKWAENEVSIEVHIFINDIDSIKNNIFAEDEDEAFGSTTGAVLKDEFYRSSIIISGKIPFWWVIPKFMTDQEYDRLYSRISPQDKKRHFIDLGNLYSIAKEDFLGAALFQLIKALSNPFKSIIKIGVLEKYLFGDEGTLLLSQKVKQRIIDDNITDEIVDAYLLMFNEVYDHYEKTLSDRDLLKILRQSLYLKINPQLSKYKGLKHSQTLSYKVSVMFSYVHEWKWSEKEMAELDNFDNWDYSQIMQFWNKVKKFMLLSYQNIATHFPKLNLANKISDSDFKLLSRKIKTQFTSEDDKIDQYITFKDTPSESILYIDPITQDIDDHQWRIYKRDTSASESFKSTTLKIEQSLVKLLAWISINQIFDPVFTRLKIQSGYSRVDQNHVTDLLTQISQLLSKTNTRLKNDYFLHPVFNLTNFIILNFNIEGAETLQTIHHLYYTSWGEAYIKEYSSSNDLIMILKQLLSDGLVSRRSFDNFCVIFSPESYKKLYKEIERLFRESYNFIVTGDHSQAAHMMVKVWNQYLSISRDSDGIAIKPFDNVMKLLSAATLQPRERITYDFYGEDQRISILKDIYSKRSPKTITTVYEETGDFILIYIINERGNLFCFVKDKNLKSEVLVILYAFFKAIAKRINSYNLLPEIDDNFVFHNLELDKYGKYTFTNESKKHEELYLMKCGSLKKLKARVVKHYKSGSVYNLDIPGFTESEFISLGSLPQKIINASGALEGSCRIVSDVKFTDLKKSDIQSGTTPFILEKYRIEYIIDKIVRNK